MIFYQRVKDIFDLLSLLWYYKINIYILFSMNPLFPILWSFLLILILFCFFLYVFKKKLIKLESRIIEMFRSRSNTIPGIYEVSKDHLTRHQDIFREVLRLKKVEFSLLEVPEKLHRIIETEGLIHHEVNFIFKVCNKHPKLLKSGNFIYMREIVIRKSTRLWDMISFYKTMVKRYNSYIQIKNYTWLWFLVPIYKETEI